MRRVFPAYPRSECRDNLLLEVSDLPVELGQVPLPGFLELLGRLLPLQAEVMDPLVPLCDRSLGALEVLLHFERLVLSFRELSLERFDHVERLDELCGGTARIRSLPGFDEGMVFKLPASVR